MGVGEVLLVALIASGIVVTVFILIYLTLARWWKSQEGQNVMLMAVTVLAAVTVGIIGRVWSVDLARSLSIYVWVAVSITFAWRTYLLLRAQLANRRRGQPLPEEEAVK